MINYTVLLVTNGGFSIDSNKAISKPNTRCTAKNSLIVALAFELFFFPFILYFSGELMFKGEKINGECTNMCEDTIQNDEQSVDQYSSILHQALVSILY